MVAVRNTKRDPMQSGKSKTIQRNSPEICNECGKSVKPGSGLFVNRIPDLNDIRTRIEMGKPFPKGDYICIICDDKFSKMSLKLRNVRN